MNQLLIIYDLGIFSEFYSFNNTCTFKKMLKGFIINILDFGVIEVFKKKVSYVFGLRLCTFYRAVKTHLVFEVNFTNLLDFKLGLSKCSVHSFVIILFLTKEDDQFKRVGKNK